MSQESFLSALGKAPVVVLAPMAGVTDYPFRQMVRLCGGASWMCSEMVASQSAIRNIRKTMARMCHQESGVVVQLAGNDPDIMAQSARMAQDRGAWAIDINMGCPDKRIALRSYSGSALMRDEPLVRRIFSTIKKAVSIPVSVKMRKGWCSGTENALSLVKMAQEEGLSHVTLHGRTRAQMFSGTADWDFIAKVQGAVTLPIIGNGDLTRLEHIVPALGKSYGVMLGRGVYGRPWFPAQALEYATTGRVIPDPTMEERHAIAKRHLEELLLYYGPQRGLFLARKHLTWYSKGIPNGAAFRLSLYAIEDPRKLWPLLREFYTKAADHEGEKAQLTSA